MATCPTCGGSFPDATFCPRDGAQLADELGSGAMLDDRYRLVRQVGAGTMGVVFEAEHVHIHRRVAVKILKRGLAGDAEVVKRLEREAQTTSDLGHPNIVQCRDFGYARDGRVYMVMEWLDGETLEARLGRDRVDAATAIEIAIQTCAGLAEAHAHDVIHRDLKPANLFLGHDRDGKLRLKILDFGIAKLAEQQVALTATGVVIGTPNYMSPEQALGDQVDARADVYALGVILYEMVTGSVPFHGDSALAVLHQHSMRIPVAPSESAPDRRIPPPLEQVVMRCLEKRPIDRYQSATELRAALEHARDRGSETAPSPPVIARSQTEPPLLESQAISSLTRDSVDDELLPARRSRAWLVALGVVAIAGTVIAVVVIGAGNEHKAEPKNASTTRSSTLDAAVMYPQPTLDALSTIDGAQVIDAAVQLAMAVPCTARYFMCTATLSHAPVAGQPLEVTAQFAAIDHGHEHDLAAGTLTARIEIRDKRTHALIAESTAPIDTSGRWMASIRLDRATMYHVHIDILQAGREMDSARLVDLDVESQQ